MRSRAMRIAERSVDIIDLPVGTKILTSNGKVYVMDQIEEGRKDSGTRYWIQEGTLQPFYVEGLDHWFPVMIIPEKL